VSAVEQHAGGGSLPRAGNRIPHLAGRQARQTEFHRLLIQRGKPFSLAVKDNLLYSGHSRQRSQIAKYGHWRPALLATHFSSACSIGYVQSQGDFWHQASGGKGAWQPHCTPRAADSLACARRRMHLGAATGGERSELHASRREELRSPLLMSDRGGEPVRVFTASARFSGPL
jgi:hypothetical protein